MRYLTLLLLLAVGCASPTPRERFVQALNYKMEGNARAYFDTLVALAHDEPDSRAGRRARATLQGGDLLLQVAMLGGIAAAMAPGSGSKSALSGNASEEPRNNLRAIASALQASQLAKGKRCTTFADCGWSPAQNSTYVYYLSRNQVAGGDGAQDPGLLRLRSDAALATMALEPKITNESYLVVAIGDPDNDGEMDIWVIDDQENLVNLVRD